MTDDRLPIAVASVSGGKDSTAVALIAIHIYGLERCLLVCADTGNEHALTYEYLTYLSEVLGKKIDIVKADFTDRLARKREYIESNWEQKGIPESIIQSALDILQRADWHPFPGSLPLEGSRAIKKSPILHPGIEKASARRLHAPLDCTRKKSAKLARGSAR